MKYKNIFFLSFFIFLTSTPLFSQKTVTDTIPYKVGSYEVKKQQKVIELAEKLKVDPEIILKLNRLRSVERVLVTGLVIKVPVYPKGYKYEPATVVINDVKPQVKPVVPDSLAKSEINVSTKSPEAKPAKKDEAKAKPETVGKVKQEEKNTSVKSDVKKEVKAVEPNLDSIAKATAKQLQKERQDNLELAKEKARQDSIRAARERVEKLRAGEEARKNYNPEIDQNNLMLLDATLELNEAMLAGIKASLDTLSKPDPEIKNKNDVKEILQRMKRARDRKELIPYLEYMNDSLLLDCSRLRIQKEDVLSRLNPYYEHLRLEDSLSKAKPITVAAPANTGSRKPVKKVEKKPESATIIVTKDTTTTQKPDVKAKDNAKPKLDTVIVFDLGTKEELKPAKEKHQKPDAAFTKNDTLYKPISDSLPKKQITAHKKAIWDTARAVIDSVYLPKPEKPKQEVKTAMDSVAITKKTIQKTASTASKVDSSLEIKKQTEQKAKTESLKKMDSVGITKQPVPKPDERKTTAAGSGTAGDSVQNIKSQFLLKRAQKAIAEKKFKLAEEYLTKSLELWSNNYDAWMTLADYDAEYGSPAKALQEYQECVRIDSSKPKLFYNIASLHLKGKKKTEAVQYFTKTISIDTGYILAYMGRASIYSDWKQYDAAIRDYDKVLQLNKSYHYAYKARGMVKQLNKRFSESVDDFTRYLIFEETDPSAYFYRGLAKIGNNELLDGCLDLSKSAEMGYEAAEKAIKRSCE